MKFGIFYEHQLPRPWNEGDEHRLIQEALDQVELADKLGIDYAWEVEHHFLEEYSHSSAPEIFLAACSQRTRNIRLGHGICLMPPKYNHPARVAERIATLDLVSNGQHRDICEALELFARDVMPEFRAREIAREKQKQEELAPYIEKAMARKQMTKPMRDEEIPVYVALGRKVAEEGTGTERQKQNARLWADAAKVTLSDPARHGVKTTATS